MADPHWFSLAHVPMWQVSIPLARGQSMHTLSNLEKPKPPGNAFFALKFQNILQAKFLSIRISKKNELLFVDYFCIFCKYCWLAISYIDKDIPESGRIVSAWVYLTLLFLNQFNLIAVWTWPLLNLVYHCTTDINDFEYCHPSSYPFHSSDHHSWCCGCVNAMDRTSLYHWNQSFGKLTWKLNHETKHT